MRNRIKVNPFLRKKVRMFGFGSNEFTGLLNSNGPYSTFDSSMFGSNDMSGANATTLQGNFNANNLYGVTSGTDVGLTNGSGAGANITGGIENMPAAGGANIPLISTVTGILGGVGNGMRDSVTDMDMYKEYNPEGTSLMAYDTSKSNVQAKLDMEEQKDMDRRNFSGVPIVGDIENFVSGANTWIDRKIEDPLNDWLFPKQKAEREANIAKTAQEELSGVTQAHYTQQNQSIMGENFAEGGLLDVKVGGTHEQNPQGGVKVGESPDGTANLVEEDEVVWKNMVFSNRF